MNERNARVSLIVLLLALTAASLLYRALETGGLKQTSALFVGVPALLALMLTWFNSSSTHRVGARVESTHQAARIRSKK